VTPRISIITPSFRQGKFLERTLHSVLSQQVEAKEYFIIDGGSKDGTVSILEQYGDCLTWVSERDRGHSDAINKGIKKSSGAIIGWLNSDDIYYPGALEAVLEYFELHPEVQVVYGDANHIDENDAFIEKYPTEDFNWERLKEVCYISQPATFLRRSVIEKYGLLDVRLRQSMDYEYWLRLAKNNVRFAHLPLLLAATRLHKEAFTVSASVACHRACNDLTRRHLGRTPDKWIFNYAHAVVHAWGLKASNRVRFALGLMAVSLFASIRWNRRITKAVLRQTAFWVGASALGWARERQRRR
jgi:glycosyltransferase involved in cell wall biosynthesis